MFRHISLRARARVLAGSVILGAMSLTQVPGAHAGVLVGPVVPAEPSTGGVAPVPGSVAPAPAARPIGRTPRLPITTPQASLDAGSMAFDDGDGYINAAEAATNIPVTWTGPAGALSAEVWFSDAAANVPAGCGPWTVASSGMGALPAGCTAGLPDGTIYFRGVWTDGTETSAEGSTTSTLDRIAPAATIALADGDGVVNASEAASGLGVSWDVTESGPAVDVAVANTSQATPSECQFADVPRSLASTISSACFAALLDGGIELTVTGADAAGNPAAGSDTSTIDRVGGAAPVVAVAPNPINASTQHAVTVSGTATGVTAHVILADQDGHSMSADASITDGAFSTVLDAGSILHDGTLTATVTITDADGNLGETGSATAVMDRVAPTAGTLTFNDGDSYINASEAQTNLPVQWNGPDDAVSASVWFVDGDNTTVPSGCGPWPTSVDGTGALPANCTASLHDGVITFRGTWTDAAGNVSVEGVGSSILDRTGPAVAITSPANGAAFPPDGTTITVTGTAEPGATVTVTHNGVPVGGATIATSGTWTREIVAPANGSHTLVATAVDVPGNSSTATSTFTIDNLIPVITQPAPGSLQPGWIVISGIGQPASFVEVAEIVGTAQPRIILRAPVNATGSWSVQGGFQTGAHTIVARGVTRLGAASAYGPARSFSVDNSAPTITITNTDLEQNPTTISGTATDTPGVARVELRYFNELTGVLMATRNATCPACGGPDAASVTWQDAPSRGLLMRVEATAIDGVGQRSSTVSRRYIAP